MGVHLPPFQQLVDAHWRDVARLACALAGPQDGEDVAQQAWAQALRAYPSLRDARNLRGWLMTVTARTATDSHRARARRPLPVDALPDDAGPPVHLAELPDEDLWRRVRALPPRQREAVALHYVVDLPHRDVAAALGTTPAASRRLVSDALAALRAHATVGGGPRDRGVDQGTGAPRGRPAPRSTPSTTPIPAAEEVTS